MELLIPCFQLHFHILPQKKKSFLPLILFADKMSLSAHNFVAPYKLIGEDALSVDKAITLLLLCLNKILLNFVFQLHWS